MFQLVRENRSWISLIVNTSGDNQSRSAALGTLVPDASSGGGAGYNIVEESNFTIEQITNQYNQITIPGGSLIFKKTGLRPGKVTKTNTRRRVGGTATDTLVAPPEPDDTGLSGLEVIDEGIKRTTSSTTKSVSRTWIILDGTVPTSLPTTYGT